MKSIGYIFALSVLCAYHGGMYGGEQQYGLFEKANIMFFGSVGCVCCVIFYILRQNNTIEQLNVQLKKEQKQNKNFFQENTKKQHIIDEMRDKYRKLCLQCLKREKEREQLLLQMGQNQYSFGKLLQENIEHRNAVERMRSLNADLGKDCLQERIHIRNLQSRLCMARQYCDKLLNADIDKANQIGKLQQHNAQLSTKYEKLVKKKSTKFEGDTYQSHSSSSSSSSDEEAKLFFWQ